jgi:hypothetical protein
VPSPPAYLIPDIDRANPAPEADLGMLIGWTILQDNTRLELSEYYHVKQYD